MLWEGGGDPVPSGCVLVTKSPQTVTLANAVLPQPLGNVLLDPRPHQPTLQPRVIVTTCLVTKPCLYCCFRVSGGYTASIALLLRDWDEDVQVQHHLSNTQHLSTDGSLLTETL